MATVIVMVEVVGCCENRSVCDGDGDGDNDDSGKNMCTLCFFVVFFLGSQ